ncbi:STAS domain-containing protein [Paractinoplanes maris]|uniref:STAS domain-containing protein n=1 Tax=Paractinoplanes maris TaxID=1734446 RepID=UPI00202278E8|nr:STAS domain-containing protein [Actinoplanes maris]
MGEQPVTTGDARAGDLEVRTADDGSVIIHLRGSVGPECAVELRQLVVRTVRHVRPLRLILDLTEVVAVDPINVGTLAAACVVGDDHQVVVFLLNPGPEIARRLVLAGVPAQRLRHQD